MLEDIAILTKAEVITEEMGLKLENTQVSQLGHARRVVVAKDTTTIVDGAGDGSRDQGRINQIKTEIENTDSDFDREKLRSASRSCPVVSRSSRSVCATETEMKEKKHRVEDALQATPRRFEEGIVPGGGVALLQATKAVDVDGIADDDEKTGARIVLRALEEPLRQIAEKRRARGLGRRQRCPQGESPAGASTPRPTRSSISSRPASSTRRWSRARRCRTPRRSPRTSSPPRRSSPRF